MLIPNVRPAWREHLQGSFHTVKLIKLSGNFSFKIINKLFIEIQQIIITGRSNCLRQPQPLNSRRRFIAWSQTIIHKWSEGVIVRNSAMFLFLRCFLFDKIHLATFYPLFLSFSLSLSLCLHNSLALPFSPFRPIPVLVQLTLTIQASFFLFTLLSLSIPLLSLFLPTL